MYTAALRRIADPHDRNQRKCRPRMRFRHLRLLSPPPAAATYPSHLAVLNNRSNRQRCAPATLQGAFDPLDPVVAPHVAEAGDSSDAETTTAGSCSEQEIAGSLAACEGASLVVFNLFALQVVTFSLGCVVGLCRWPPSSLPSPWLLHPGCTHHEAKTLWQRGFDKLKYALTNISQASERELSKAGGVLFVVKRPALKIAYQ